ncbi:MAG TPA: hypothetical protein VFM97_04365 [Gammaproteobacteria bacterium]|nr:hypothetical protein [Gammaproteobacteria bacterium]
MTGESHTTTDHETIKRWVEARDGLPATVRDTESQGEKAGILRIEFPDADGDDQRLEQIGWDEFFDKFEESDLAFLYQEETTGGDTSRFFKFVSREKH